MAIGNEHGATAPNRTYIGLSVSLVCLMAAQTTNHLWSNIDFWVWLGPVREFAARPFNPTHPLIAVDAGDPYMGPYTFVLGMIARWTATDPITVLAVGGVFSLVLLVVGTWVLTREVSAHPWAPTIALVFGLLAWGWKPWRWAGYLNLNSLGVHLTSGSTFAYGLGLCFLASFLRWLDLGQSRYLALAGIAYPTMLLSHQITGLWVTLRGCPGFC